MRQRIVFLTFGCEKYYNQVARISSEANKLKCFDDIISLTDKDLLIDSNFNYLHRDFFTHDKFCRGFGYWLWKPYIIKERLLKMKDDDILVYVDSGSVINENGRKRIFEYIEMLNLDGNHGVLSFQMCHLPEIKYTKRALLSYLETNLDDMRSGQFMATVIIIKKNLHSMHIMNEWYRIASINELINDDKGSEEEYKFFQDHRHDQSIYSLLVKKYGSIKIPDETYFAPDWSNGKYYPFWATRIRN